MPKLLVEDPCKAPPCPIPACLPGPGPSSPLPPQKLVYPLEFRPERRLHFFLLGPPPTWSHTRQLEYSIHSGLPPHILAHTHMRTQPFLREALLYLASKSPGLLVFLLPLSTLLIDLYLPGLSLSLCPQHSPWVSPLLS